MSKRQRVEDDDASSNKETELENNTSKYFHIDRQPQSLKSRPAIQCTLAPHSRPVCFSSYEDYEVHYAQFHSNRCSECQKNFPTQYFLTLHISENHDPINEARRARGDKTYACFVEDCDKVCSTPQKRRMHLVDKHMFPKNYDFFIVNDGLNPNRRGSMLRPAYRPKYQRQSSGGARVSNQGSNELVGTDEGNDSEEGRDEDEEAMPVLGNSVLRQDEDVDALAHSMSALKFVPPSVRFGRGSRGGFARR